MKFLKYFAVFMMFLSAINAGLSISSGDYLFAGIYIGCVFINYLSYKSLSLRY